MRDNWKKLQKEVIARDKRFEAPFTAIEQKVKQLTKVMKDPDGYNTNLASKERMENVEDNIEHLETQLEDLSINSHPPVEFTKKLQQLHDKIDSIYTILETLSDRLNKLEYNGEITYGEPYNVGRSNKHVTVSLRREQKEPSAPNPHGDDDFATP